MGTPRASTGKGYVAWTARDGSHTASPTPLQTLDQQLAMPPVEVDACLRKTGRPQTGARPLVFFPHNIEEALDNLVTRGHVDVVEHGTKGGRVPTSTSPADTVRGRRTVVAAATRRKAMLYALIPQRHIGAALTA